MGGDGRVWPETFQALGVRLFPPIPKGFDPVKASAGELREYGYPHRPDARVHPERYRRWKQMVSGLVSRIDPEFGIGPVQRFGIGPAVRPTVNTPVPDPLPTQATSANWAGSVVYPRGNAVTSVMGEWTVPAVTDPVGGEGVASCATWIGIDGWTEENAQATDILQAGTTQLTAQFLGGSTASTFAWSEWYPEAPVPITNLAVSPGDVMFCEITARSPTEASIVLVNLNTGRSTSFMKTAPGTTRLIGATAEWILELPTTASGLATTLANYGAVFFDSCVAFTSSGELNGGDGELLTMVNAGNIPISIPLAEGDQVIKISWTDGTEVA